MKRLLKRLLKRWAAWEEIGREEARNKDATLWSIDNHILPHKKVTVTKALRFRWGRLCIEYAQETDIFVQIDSPTLQAEVVGVAVYSVTFNEDSDD